MRRSVLQNGLPASFLLLVCWLGLATAQDLRLTNVFMKRDLGYTAGRLEMLPKGQSAWSTVCGKGFNNADASVACRQLGFDRGMAVLDGSLGQGDASQPIGGSGFQCTGTESSLLSCKYQSGGSSCTHKDDVGVLCISDSGQHFVQQEACNLCMSISSKDRTVNTTITASNCAAFARSITTWSKQLTGVTFTTPFACDSYSGSVVYKIRVCASVASKDDAIKAYTIHTTNPVGLPGLAVALATILVNGGTPQTYIMEYACPSGAEGTAAKTIHARGVVGSPSFELDPTPAPAPVAAPSPAPTPKTPSPSPARFQFPMPAPTAAAPKPSSGQPAQCQACLTVDVGGRSGSALTQQQCADFANRASSSWLGPMLTAAGISSPAPLSCTSFLGGSGAAQLKTCSSMALDTAQSSVKIFFGDAQASSLLSSLLGQAIGDTGDQRKYNYGFSCISGARGSATRTEFGKARQQPVNQACSMCMTASGTGRVVAMPVTADQCAAFATRMFAGWANSIPHNWDKAFTCDSYSGTVSPVIKVCSVVASSSQGLSNADQSQYIVQTYNDQDPSYSVSLGQMFGDALGGDGGTTRMFRLDYDCPDGSYGYTAKGARFPAWQGPAATPAPAPAPKPSPATARTPAPALAPAPKPTGPPPSRQPSPQQQPATTPITRSSAPAPSPSPAPKPSPSPSPKPSPSPSPSPKPSPSPSPAPIPVPATEPHPQPEIHEGVICNLCVLASTTERLGGAVTEAQCAAFAGLITDQVASTLSPGADVPLTYTCNSIEGTTTEPNVRVCATTDFVAAKGAIGAFITKSEGLVEVLSKIWEQSVVDGGVERSFTAMYQCSNDAVDSASTSIDVARQATGSGSSSTGSSGSTSTVSAPAPLTSPTPQQCSMCVNVTVTGRSGSPATAAQCDRFAAELTNGFAKALVDGTSLAFSSSFVCASFKPEVDTVLAACANVDTEADSVALLDVFLSDEDDYFTTILEGHVALSLRDKGKQRTYWMGYSCPSGQQDFGEKDVPEIP